MDGYKTLYSKNKREIEEMKFQRILGLEKLADASVQVEILKGELVEKEKEIIIATAASTEVMCCKLINFQRYILKTMSK